MGDGDMYCRASIRGFLSSLYTWRFTGHHPFQTSIGPPPGRHYISWAQHATIQALAPFSAFRLHTVFCTMHCNSPPLISPSFQPSANFPPETRDSRAPGILEDEESLG